MVGTQIHKGAAFVGILAALAFGLGTAGPALAQDGKIRVLIVDGQNNHNWRVMTPPMKADLERSGRFTVDVATTPGPKAPSIGLGFVPPRFLQVRRGAQQLQRRAVARGGPQGARGIRRQGGRAGDHPRGE